MGVLGLYKDGKKIDKVEFPITKPGDSSTVTYQVKNEAFNFADIISIIVHDKEVIIEKAPKGLEPNKTQDIVLTWKPSKDSITPLNTKIEFEEVVG
jgi:plasmid replication initiation protein